MASTVNSQVTDSITEVDTEVIGNAPSIAMGNLYQATAQALANAAHNATVIQQQANILGQAVTAQGVALIYSIKFT
jgi:hypothetical protein